MRLSHRGFLKEFLFVQSQTVTIHTEMWKNMAFSLEQNHLLYELKITTTYLKSSFIFLKTKDTCMNFYFFSQLWQLKIFSH
jgi:hypothetical protein